MVTLAPVSNLSTSQHPLLASFPDSTNPSTLSAFTTQNSGESNFLSMCSRPWGSCGLVFLTSLHKELWRRDTEATTVVWSPRNSQVPSPHPFWTFTPYLACDFHLFKRLLAQISVFLLLPPFKVTSCFSGAQTAHTRHSTREVSSWPATLAHHLIGVPSYLVAPLPWSWWEEFYEIWDSNYFLSHLKGVTSTHSLHPWTDSTRNQVHTKNTFRLETGHPPAVASIGFGLSCTEHIRTPNSGLHWTELVPSPWL